MRRVSPDVPDERPASPGGPQRRADPRCRARGVSRRPDRADRGGRAARRRRSERPVPPLRQQGPAAADALRRRATPLHRDRRGRPRRARRPRECLDVFIAGIVDADVHSLTVKLAGTFPTTPELFELATRAHTLNERVLARARNAGAVRAGPRPQRRTDDLRAARGDPPRRPRTKPRTAPPLPGPAPRGDPPPRPTPRHCPARRQPTTSTGAAGSEMPSDAARTSADVTASELLAAYRDRRLSPVEVFAALLRGYRGRRVQRVLRRRRRGRAGRRRAPPKSAGATARRWAARRRAGRDQGPRPDARLADPARLAHDRPRQDRGTRTARRWRGCARPAR